ncbi:hypothetical protein BLOT_002958 [Blomia tropicalis]|nr:hypothetical protein BLOT_002958 [Blomia tropicalis]
MSRRQMNNGRFNSGSIRLPFNGACVLGVVRPGGGIRPDISTILFYFDTRSCLIRQPPQEANVEAAIIKASEVVASLTLFKGKAYSGGCSASKERREKKERRRPLYRVGFDHMELMSQHDKPNWSSGTKKVLVEAPLPNTHHHHHT